MRWNSAFFLLLSGLCGACAGQGGLAAEGFDLPQLQATILETIDRVQPAVVLITGRGSSFSGVIVSREGHVLSVAHAVEPGARYRVILPDGRRLRGTGKGANPRADAALIQLSDVPDDLPFVPMGSSAALAANQPCIGLSYPGGQRADREPIVRFGRIVGNGRPRGMLQSSVLMEPGDSGGPLIDLNGCVVGIHSRIGVSMDRNYEVPVDVYRRFWNELNREQLFFEAGPPTPRLGVRTSRGRRPREDAEEQSQGLEVLDVVPDEMAAAAGIQQGDTLLRIEDTDIHTSADLREALIAARDDGAQLLHVALIRDEEMLEIEIPFEVEREAAPEVALPSSDLPEVPEPKGFAELADVAGQLAELEARLDDACVQITSGFDDDVTRTICGTKVRGTRWVLSKSSEVGEDPRTTVDGETVPLSVQQRDATNDLVLLAAPEPHASGIDLTQTTAGLAAGTFVLSPDDDGEGVVSVVGSRSFRSQKWESRGFLGVMPGTYGENEGAILTQVNDDGAANRAGLLVGDIITKLNDTIIRTQNDLRSFLAEADPNAVIEATLLREEDELVKSVVLGSAPTGSSHAADQVAKSGRRDGFSEVVPHDAVLQPDECGGPLYSLDGELLGLNIARHSRVRSYVLPAAMLKELVDTATAAVAP